MDFVINFHWGGLMQNVLRRGRKAAIALLAGAAVAAFSTGSAHAVKSWQGDNYSEDYNSKKDIRNCDMESDSRHTYAEYRINTGEWSSVTDGNGANNGCVSRGPYTSINEHYTCEAIDFFPDACGSSVYP